MSEEHPARAAAQRSIDAVHTKNKEAWVANFAADGFLEDPVGKSPLDPTGEGHHGREAIAAFWDKNIGPNRVIFNVTASYAGGDECANVGSLTTHLSNGMFSVVNLVMIYRVKPDGKVHSLRAFWELPKMNFVPPPKEA